MSTFLRVASSSRARPIPSTTLFSGSSVSVTGIPVSSASSRSRPRSSDPPPAIMIPRSTISAASSGGVRSSVVFTAATIPAIGSAIAARISVLVIRTARGNPDTRSRPPDLNCLLLALRARRADGDLDAFRRPFADQQVVRLASVLNNGFVHLVPGDAKAAHGHDPPHRDDGDFSGPTADIDYHASHRLGNRQPSADRGRHRLFDQVRFAGAGLQRRIDDGALFHL